MTKVTITRRTQPPQQGGGDVFLFSKEDGMLFAMVAVDTAYWGEDPTKWQTRCFISMDTAMQFAKERCKEMLGRDDIDFLVANEERLVKSVSMMPTNMPRRN